MRMRIARRVGLVTVALLILASACLFGPNFSKKVYSQSSGAKVIDFIPLSKYDLVHDSELIILGKVLYQYSEIPTIRNILQVDKVIKGKFDNKTMDVITEGDLSGNIVVEGPAKFQKGEKAILFLYREQDYGGEYTTLGLEQGKYHVDSNGLVEGKVTATEEYWPLNATSLADFEADIKNVLNQPKPEPIAEESAPYGRDLTTEEVKELENTSELERNTTGDYEIK
jgi:hypothetical protein